MSELASLLCKSIERQSRRKNVSLLLSGGMDSLSVGLCLERAGKRVHAYTYHLEGYASDDLDKAVSLARQLRWKLEIISVPTSAVASDFIRLAVEHRCARKTQFEVMFPLLYIFPLIEEREIWTGWNADTHYGNTKNYMFRQRRLRQLGWSAAKRKAAFHKDRRSDFNELSDPTSQETWWWGNKLAKAGGKSLLDPYNDECVFGYFSQFTHEQLSPLNKPIIRREFADDLSRISKGSVTVGVQLQTGGRVDDLFETLLTNRTINRFKQRDGSLYTTVSALCQRWGGEVSAGPKRFIADLKRLPMPLLASQTTCGAADYKPYKMKDVSKASSAANFTVVSTFAGGGGSSIGYRLAGGSVLLINEFIKEAARTYATNFPETLVDTRDIRKINGIKENGIHVGPQQFIGQVGLGVRDLDILDGSPPCSQFSAAGRGLSERYSEKTYSDKSQRGIGTLFYDFFYIAKRILPKVVVAENVPNLASKKNGALFREFLEALRYKRFPGKANLRAYYANWKILSSRDFAVLQDRRRLFVIGIRKDVAEEIGIRSDDDVLRVFAQEPYQWVSIRSALSNLRQRDADVAPWRRAMMTSPLGRQVAKLPPNPVRKIGLKQVGIDTGSNFNLIRSAWDQAAPTLAVTGQKPDGMSGVIHPSEDRKFTLAELRRLFGLPDDYVLTGNLNQSAERICRMVTPFVTKAIAESIYERVLKPYRGATS